MRKIRIKITIYDNFTLIKKISQVNNGHNYSFSFCYTSETSKISNLLSTKMFFRSRI